MAVEVTRTYVGSIQNYRQVRDGLDSLGDSASKIWNVALPVAAHRPDPLAIVIVSRVVSDH